MLQDLLLAKNQGGKLVPLVLVGTYLVFTGSYLTRFTDNTDAQTVRRSSRPTKGKGGQIVQMENIERAQLERTASSRPSHASQLEQATANELLNPMAPTKPKPKPRVKMSSTHVPDVDSRSEFDLVCIFWLQDCVLTQS